MTDKKEPILFVPALPLNDEGEQQIELPWKELETNEVESLGRVHQAVRTELVSDRTPERQRHVFRHVWGGALATALCGLLLWGTLNIKGDPLPTKQHKANPTPQPTKPPQQLTKQGTLRVQASSDTKGTQYLVSVPPAAQGVLTRPHWWQIEASGAASFQLRYQRLRSALYLKRGHLSVHVIPSRKQHFRIRCSHQFEVVVKGTKFAVFQADTWLRVEVYRGEVELRHPTFTLGALKAGHGIRVELNSGKQERYPAPALAMRFFHQRQSWLQQLSRQQLLQFVQDMSTHKRLTKAQRRIIWEQVAIDLERRRQYTSSMRLWLRIHATETNREAKRMALANAAFKCHKSWSQSRGKARCMGLYQQYRKTYKRSQNSVGEKELDATILFFMIEHEKTKRKYKNMKRLISRYLRTYRSHSEASKVIRWSRRIRRR